MEPVTVVTTVAGLVEACVNLLCKLRQSYEKYAEHKEKIDSAEEELKSIYGAIKDKESCAANACEDEWIVDLEEIKRRIEDSIDHYNFKVMRQSDETRKLRGAIVRVVDVLLDPRKKLLEDLEAISKRIKQVNERAHQRCRCAQLQHAHQAAKTTYQHPKVAEPDGWEATIEELVQTMGNKDLKTRVVVAISGPSGSGKSVLAEAVYRQAVQEFNYKAWVTASSRNNPKVLLKDITDQLGLKPPAPSMDPVEYLRAELIRKGKRYIIGIEEIESKYYWDIIENAFDNVKRIRIIVTTRSEDVAQHCSKNCRAYKMQPLDRNSARNLLVKKAFDGTECPNNLDDGLSKILETCEYLPVAIANMGVYMKSKSTRWNNHNCEEICKGIGSLLVNNVKDEFTGMKHVFDCRYNSLSCRAKTCLLSLISTCPNVDENGGIKRKSVIRRWLAERLIEGTDTKSAEDLANECFTALVNQNFIIPVKVSLSAQIKTFRVHRMMLPYIRDKAISRKFVTRLDIHQGKKIEVDDSTVRLCLHNSSTDYAWSREAIDLSSIRLLTFHGKANNALNNFRSTVFLRVLVLENIENLKNDNLDAFCSPSMLKYLSIRGNKDVSKLPKNIVNLRMLETLDTRDTKVHKIPMDVILLPELRHLFGEFQITGIMSKRERVQQHILQKNNFRKENSKRKRLLNVIIPQNNIPIKNSKLQTLAGFLIDESPDFITLLHHMPVLSKVRIMCRKTTLSDKVIQDLLDCLNSCLEMIVKDGNSRLHSLSIDFHTCNLNFLDSLKVEFPFLHSLKLRGNMRKLPNFILSLSGSLIELCLLETYLGGRVLSMLQYLENLQFLKITEHPEFKEPTFQLTFERGWFCSLKHLYLDVPKIPKIIIKEHAMEGLESLQLFCKELGGFSGILHLKQLNEVILPTQVSGAEADDLLQQINEHRMKPKLLDDDGSSWPMFFNKYVSNSGISANRKTTYPWHRNI